MRRSLLIVFFVFVSFLLEYWLFNWLGPWLTPDFPLILVIFFSLSLGTRYGLLAATVGGLLRDSFDIGPLGFSVFSFAVCACVTPVIRKYLYHTGSASSRLLLVFCVGFVNVVIQYGLYLKFGPIGVTDVLKAVLLPEILPTLAAAHGTIEVLRKCVSKSFASLS